MSSEAAGLARDVETLGRDLGAWLGKNHLPPEAAEALRSLIDRSGRLAALQGDLAATISAHEGKLADLVAQVTALSAQIVRLERTLYGSRSEKKKDSAQGTDDASAADTRRRGGKPGRRKERGDALSDTGLRFNDKAPVVDITVMPPESEGLSPENYDIVSERVMSRIATLDYRHVVLRHHHVTIKLHESGALVGAPAREGVFKNSCADVSFIAVMLIDKFLWHLPIHRQHRMLAPAGITINRGSPSLWANRAIALLKPIHDTQWRSVLDSDIIEIDETPIRAGRQPGKPSSIKKGFLWPVLGDRGEVVFPFLPSRAHGNVPAFLGDYTGTLVC